MRPRFIIPLLLSLSSVALGQTPEELERAKMFFQAGAQAYAKGQFDRAISAFEEAYKVVPKPQLLFSRAQAERKQFIIDKRPELLAAAIEHYRAYLKQVETGGRRADAADALAELERISATSTAPRIAPPTTPQKARTGLTVTSQTPGARISLDGAPPVEAPLVEDVSPGKHTLRIVAEHFVDAEREVLVREGAVVPLDITLAERPSLLSVKTQHGADIAIDGKMIATTPLERPLELPSGPHTVSVLKNGRRPYTRDVTLERGKSLTLKAPLQVTGQRVAAYAVLGTGLVGSLLGGTFVGLSLVQEGRASDIASARATRTISGEELDRYNNAIDARDRLRTAATVALGASAGVLAIGAVLYLFDRPTTAVPEGRRGPEPQNAPKKPESLEVSVLPALGPTFTGGAVSGRF